MVPSLPGCQQDLNRSNYSSYQNADNCDDQAFVNFFSSSFDNPV